MKTFRRTPGLGQLKSALLDVIVGGSVVDDDDALGLNLGGPGKDDLAVQQTVVKTCEDDLGGTGAVTGRLGFLGGSRGGLDRCVGVGQTGAGLVDEGRELGALDGDGAHSERQCQRNVETADNRELRAVLGKLDHVVVDRAAEHIGQHIDGVVRVERGDHSLNLIGDGLLVVTSKRHDVDVRHVAENHLERVFGACGQAAMRCENDLIHLASSFSLWSL